MWAVMWSVRVCVCVLVCVTIKHIYLDGAGEKESFINLQDIGNTTVSKYLASITTLGLGGVEKFLFSFLTNSLNLL